MTKKKRSTFKHRGPKPSHKARAKQRSLASVTREFMESLRKTP
jgi:hypothetical protein